MANDPWISVTNATHYVLDGVPMRIAENFRPKAPKRDVLPPLRFNVAQSKVFDFKYEYTTEKGYIQWHEDFVQAERAQAKLKEEKIEEKKRVEKQKEEAAKSVNFPPAQSLANSLHSSTNKLENTKPVSLAPVISDTILLPQRVSPEAESSSSKREPNSYHVNVQDFESLAEDPFDNLELKTINDMKELESVLANTQALQLSKADSIAKHSSSSAAIPADPSVQTPPAVRKEVCNDVAEVSVSANGDVLPSDQVQIQSESESTHQQQLPVEAPSAHNDLNGGRPSPSVQFSRGADAVNIGISSSSTQQQPNIKPKPPPVTKPKPKVDLKANNSKLGGASEVNEAAKADSKVHSLANALQKDLGKSMFRPPGAPKGFSYVSTTMNDTSSTENHQVQSIEWPSLTPTPHSAETMPSFPQSSTGTMRNELHSSVGPYLLPRRIPLNNEMKKNKPSRPAPPRPVSRPAPPRPVTTPAPPRPVSRPHPASRTAPPRPAYETAPPVSHSNHTYAEVSTDPQIEQSLLSMGFERTQICSAIKFVGSDMKQLVEHLCAVQKMTVNGANWQTAEQAVLSYPNDSEKAEQFMKAHQKLSEFGFSNDKIKDALVACDMDLQKAVDKLI